MTKTFITGLFAAALLATAAAPALADGQGRNGQMGQHGPRTERLLEMFDKNGDKAITADEVLQQRADMFTSIDTNSDGQLTADELKSLQDMRKARREEARADMQGDAGQRGPKWMGRGGNDRDGMRGGERGFGKQKFAQRGQDRGMKGQNMQGRGGERGGPNLARLDTDGNGTISMDEFTANSDRMFKRFDRNGDGKIDQADFGQRGPNRT